jgi:hypothetical protein
MGDLGLTLQILISLLAFAALLLVAGAWYQHAGTIRDARRFPAPGRLIDIGRTHTLTFAAMVRRPSCLKLASRRPR